MAVGSCPVSEYTSQEAYLSAGGQMLENKNEPLSLHSVKNNRLQFRNKKKSIYANGQGARSFKSKTSGPFITCRSFVGLLLNENFPEPSGQILIVCCLQLYGNLQNIILYVYLFIESTFYRYRIQRK
jgi:hypothetical protein